MYKFRTMEDVYVHEKIQSSLHNKRVVINY